MKPAIISKFLDLIFGSASEPSVLPFRKIAPTLAFVQKEAVALDFMKISTKGFDSFLFFIEGNFSLKSLSLMGNKLQYSSLESLSKALALRQWPNISELNLSYNKMDLKSVNEVMIGVAAIKIKVLKLAGCLLKPNVAPAISNLIATHPNLTSLDLSFNTLGGKKLFKFFVLNISYMTVCSVVHHYILFQ